ncbi:hypothetical protein [Asticcacaulis sp. YBE204]|uniref:DUF4870 family protein n=1 Tax=Asticcacaulis sp. YBE204 TaxID=1282363 RepID=UPI0003C3C368|nr:hypothetical protein [Asticcacaulis sp. YBE204]ESQ79701.1 hypothetical protein AEYBE204_07610 [Asticcacaulis sp. YBE204]
MTANTPAPAREKISDKRIVPVINYLLLFCMMIGGVTGVLAITLIYLFQDDAPDWLKSHYAFQKRTFWIGIAVFIPIALLLPTPVMHSMVLGSVVLIVAFLLFLWIVGRCTVGFNHIFHKRAYPHPKSWLV